MKHFFLAILLIFGTPLLASALEIGYSNVNPFTGRVDATEGLLLRGEIVPGDYAQLIQLVKRDSLRFWQAKGVILASQGGDIQEALRIARFVKGTYTMVWVGEALGPCVSACFFIYSAAVRRDAGASTLGIHRPYLHPSRLKSMSAPEVEATQKKVFQEARRYLESQDVPTNLIDKMFQYASTDVYWLTRVEIEEQLGRSPPWYEQFLIARCGFDKAIERKYWATQDKEALKHLSSAHSCGDRLAAPDALAFLKSELNTVATRKYIAPEVPKRSSATNANPGVSRKPDGAVKWEDLTPVNPTEQNSAVSK